MEKQDEKTQEQGCNDRFCPFHGSDKLKLRGKVFKGTVKKKFSNRVVVVFERMVKIPKYERYERRKRKIHARLPDCLKNEVEEGDRVEMAETRPLSKTINTVVTKLIRSQKE